MIKRPLYIGAVLLVGVLLLGNCLGVPKEAPPFSEDVLYSQNGEKRVQVLGRVKKREVTARGTRLYLNQISFLLSNTVENDSAGTEQVPSINANLNINIIDSSNSTNKLNSKNISYLNETTCDWQILIYMKSDTRDIPYIGSWVVAEGKCERPDAAANPGQFDARRYYLLRKVALFLYDGIILRKDGGGKSLESVLTECRERLCASYTSILSREDAAVISAITMGERTGLSDAARRSYQEGGIAHILAISSLHITLVGRTIYRLLRKRRWSFAVAGVCSAVVLLCFCLMTGMSVSAVRAFVMFGLWLGSQVAGRTSDTLTGAGLAAMIILTGTPEYLEDSAFLLSFCCILSLQYLTPMVEWILPVPGKVGKALGSSVAIQIGTMPVTMYFFYQITPYAFLVNLVVLPCMALLMAAGMFGGVVGMISVPAGTMAAAPCHYLLRWFELLCRWERRLPGAVMITGRPAVWQIAVYYGILASLCYISGKSMRGSRIDGGHLENAKAKRRKKGRTKGNRIFRWLMIWIAVAILSFRIRPQLRITFLDVGQGDGILIESGEYAFMIDGGSSTVDEVWQYRIENSLKYYGISCLDAVFLSHGDHDHISGIWQLLEDYEPNLLGENVGGITLEQLILPDAGYEEEKLRSLREMAEEQNIQVGYLGSGGRFFMGNLTIECLYPDAECATGDGNEDSMVLRLEYGGFSALFTGDLELAGERHFLESRRQKQVTLLKVGHHGSKNATSKEFLEVFQPELAIISCGKDNQYGHPAPELLERLSEAGTKIFRTDLEGAVTVAVDAAGSWTVN